MTDNDRIPIAIRLATYFYFLSPALRANTIDCAGIIVSKSELDRLPEHYLCDVESERDTILKHFEHYQEFVMDDQDTPMVHHYSLVRTKEEMLKKVQSWGHREDKEWPELIRHFYDHLGENKYVTPYAEVMTCIVAHAHHKIIYYNNGLNRSILRPCEPIMLTLGTQDRLRLRSEGVDVVEREPISTEAIITDYWFGHSYSFVEPYITNTSYLTDPLQIKQLLKIAPIDTKPEIS